MASKDKTVWTASVDTSKGTPVAALGVSINDGPPKPFKIKGVCYSPCPIGGSNAWGPNIGDWFWDSYKAQDTQITGWKGTWSHDLPGMTALHANVVRVYCFLDTQLPPASPSHVFTHQKFLDDCYANGLFVLVGIPLPQSLFQLGGQPAPSAEWWTTALRKTVEEVAGHPAVLGFTIANEVDNGGVDTYGPAPNAKYWWDQVEAMARIAKKAAPGKLVGIANHDDPGICDHCGNYGSGAGYMAHCPSIDFWGVNSYQPQSFASVFGKPGGKGYAALTGGALKPVLLTEYGFPATSRKTADTLRPSGIYSDSATESNVAGILNTMLPAAYAEPLCPGLFYFEFCDEWWNQSAYTIQKSQKCPGAHGPDAPDPSQAPPSGASFGPFKVYEWNGGPIACGFPNYYWDNEGFGLYSVGVGAGRNPQNPWDSATNAPALPLDTRTPRKGILKAVEEAFQQAGAGLPAEPGDELRGVPVA